MKYYDTILLYLAICTHYNFSNFHMEIKSGLEQAIQIHYMGYQNITWTKSLKFQV